MHGGTGIRTRGPGTAAGLRFSSFHRIGGTRRVAGYKTSRENRPKTSLAVVWRRFWLAVLEHSALVNGQRSRLLGGGLDLDSFGCGCALRARLSRCNRDKPRAGFLQADFARRNPLLRLFIRRNFASPTCRHASARAHDFAGFKSGANRVRSVCSSWERRHERRSGSYLRPLQA